ncbi:MAG TPA: glycosyltransferase family 2 protein [Candidatus Pacearchaeota archaeon]|nr:glycosyltransferase family 2 protein [Candidatus Pacearchaeota archaeon]
MNFVDFIFFFYTFIGLYMLVLMIIVYFPHRKEMFFYHEGKPEPVSIVMPCYNEGENIGKAIDNLLNLNYPKDMLEIIIVDDCSKDNSVEIVKTYAEKYENVRLIVNKKNSGGAAEPTNIGIKAAKFDYIAVADADSYPEKDALLKMIGFLQKDKEIGGVTGAVLAKEAHSFAQKLQYLEYVVICFARKLLDYVDAVYVTPGPFALYRKKVLLEIGLFDKKNLTQDIEIVWRMMSHGYKARMSLDAKIYTVTPKTFKRWWKQRVRWNIGGTQTILKYKKWALRKNMLGMFVIPFFSMSLFIGVIGIILFTYLITRSLLLTYFSTHYSIVANEAVTRLISLSFNPTILNFFGISLFLLGCFYTLFALMTMKELNLKNINLFNLIFFLTLYLMIYPLVMISSLYKLAIKKYSW